MRIISAIIRKQILDTLKNKAVLIQFVMFPILAIIMNFSVKIDGMPHNFFVNLFGTMYVGMAPLIGMAAIISEEKEDNTLRILMVSDVKPMQYLIGIGGYIWGICMLGVAVFCVVGKYTKITAVCFIGIMSVGILCSVIIGAVIGVGSKNQMAATSITVPVMILFSFLPMISMFNDTIKNVARLTYTEQINLMINEIEKCKVTFENIFVICINIVLALILFCYIYRKKGLFENTN